MAKESNGHPFPRTAQRGDEPDSVEGHEAGDGRAPSPACTGVPDRKEYAALEAVGWHVIVMWKCEVESGINFLADEIKAVYPSKE